jgi:hypothetical protein
MRFQRHGWDIRDPASWAAQTYLSMEMMSLS